MHQTVKNVCGLFKKLFLRIFFSLAVFMQLQLVVTYHKKKMLSRKTLFFMSSAGTFGPVDINILQIEEDLFSRS